MDSTYIFLICFAALFILGCIGSISTYKEPGTKPNGGKRRKIKYLK
jgi:hypothetical protein